MSPFSGGAPRCASVITQDRAVVKTKTHFAFRIDIWDDVGGVVEHVTGVDDFEVATATYEAAVRR